MPRFLLVLCDCVELEAASHAIDDARRLLGEAERLYAGLGEVGEASPLSRALNAAQQALDVLVQHESGLP